MNNDDNDFQAAFIAELGGTPPDTESTTPPAPTPANGEGEGGEQTPAAGTEGEQPVTPPAGSDQPKDGEPAAPQGGEQPNPADGEQPKPGEPAKAETPEEKANREALEAAQAEAPKPLTPDDIKNAVRDYHSETTQRVEQVHQARNEIIEKIYPEGIDKNIYDSNGQVVKTAQDIVDRGLINERTGEPYTYDEAASFMLEAGRKMSENIEELNSWAENVAEQNISLVEGNHRVMEQWGDVLKAMPKLAQELAAEYVTTQLEFDKTGSYITRMGMAPEAYYNRVMAPYKQLGEALAAKAALEQSQQTEQQQQQQQNEQNERNGLPPQRGTSTVKANTGDEMVDALVDELNKG